MFPEQKLSTLLNVARGPFVLVLDLHFATSTFQLQLAMQPGLVQVAGRPSPSANHNHHTPHT
jgi:hypothetical protein